MEYLTWKKDKFIAQDEDIDAHLISLEKNHNVIIQMLQKCDFILDSYKVIEGKVIVTKNSVEFKEEDEGKGFCICLHLFAYLLIEEKRFQKIDNHSFRYYLHENLYKHLIRVIAKI